MDQHTEGEKGIKELSMNNTYRKIVLLAAGAVLMILSDIRGSAGIFAWFMPVPFLLYVISFSGAKNHLLLLGTLVLSAILTLLKSISEPYIFSVSFSVLSGVITGIRYFLVFLLWGLVRRKTDSIESILFFPALVVGFEFLQAFFDADERGISIFFLFDDEPFGAARGSADFDDFLKGQIPFTDQRLRIRF